MPYYSRITLDSFYNRLFPKAHTYIASYSDDTANYSYTVLTVQIKVLQNHKEIFQYQRDINYMKSFHINCYVREAYKLE